jgi:hypothetical protein
MKSEILSITQPPKHHFFGFHDLSAWNYSGDKILSLEVETINRPPLPLEAAGLGFVNSEGRFIRLGTTTSFNFPQGARQQWIGNTNYFIVNNIRENQWASDVYDTDLQKLVAVYPFACHHLNNTGEVAYSINYARLFRLGAYGYPGIEDSYKFDPMPERDGIWIGDLTSYKKELLVSIKEVATIQNNTSSKACGHHYLTHLLLNPSNNRLAFLHRYALPDGGEITRLMTIGTNGRDLRCLASGYLSHFDWKDSDTILIFGRLNNSLDSIRTSKIFSLPHSSFFLKIGKSVGRRLFKNHINAQSGFVLVHDLVESEYFKIGAGVLTEDGHPMLCPTNRDWIINDTYPDQNGYRTLMLYNISKNRRIDLGHFKMINEEPDLSLKSKYFKGVEPKILKDIQENNLAFTRSGLHCDLHPRWDKKGEKVAFDSIHEGSRQIYMIDIDALKVIN